MNNCETPGGRRVTVSALMVTAMSWASLSSPAHAQVDATPTFSTGQADDPQANDSGSTLQDIVVTAQRREESLQRTPISVTAISEAALQQSGVRDISDVAQLTPNVNIDKSVTLSGSSVATALFIRGVGQSDFLLTTDPGVGLYLDGVYIARSVGSLFDVIDVERVEVLRGPQGTLYGKNTIGGAISVVTKRPDMNEFEGRISATLGSFDRHDLTASVNVPLSDSAAFRLSGATLNQDGYVTLVNSGEKLGNIKRWAVRAAFAVDIGPNLKIDIGGDYMRARENSGASTLVAISPDGVPVRANAMLGLIYDDRYIPNDPYLAYGDPKVSNADVWGVNATATLNLGAVTLKSITAYRGFESFFERDNDLSPLLVIHGASDQRQRQFTQEVQALGDLADGRINFILGGFFADEQGQDFARLFTRQITVILDQRDIDTRSYAAFAQVTVKPTDALSLTGGIRYTHDRKSIDPDTFISAITPGTGGPPPFVIGLPIVPRGLVSRSFEKTTYRLAAQYQWTDSLMTYASYSTGFKSGGFVQRNAAFSATVPSFGPETVAVLEGGVKWTGFDQRLRLSAAAFNNKYRDLQITVNTPIPAGVAPQTQNAGAAEINGFEAEAELLIGSGLHVLGGIAYLDAKYTSLAPNVTDIDLNSKLVRAPEWSGTMSVFKDFGVGGGTLTPRLDFAFSSRVFYESVNRLSQPSYGVFNGTLNYTTSDKGWGLTLGARNLFDKRYFIGSDSRAVPGDFGYEVVTYARPREFFGSVTVNF